MEWRKTIRFLAAAAALFALLLIVSQVGEAFEAWQHQDCATHPYCLICHLGHQVVGSVVDHQPLFAPRRLGLLSVVQMFVFIPSPLESLLGTRAPPTA
jgi:hypothetical protein